MPDKPGVRGTCLRATRQALRRAPAAPAGRLRSFPAAAAQPQRPRAPPKVSAAGRMEPHLARQGPVLLLCLGKRLPAAEEANAARVSFVV